MVYVFKKKKKKLGRDDGTCHEGLGVSRDVMTWCL